MGNADTNKAILETSNVQDVLDLETAVDQAVHLNKEVQSKQKEAAKSQNMMDGSKWMSWRDGQDQNEENGDRTFATNGNIDTKESGVDITPKSFESRNMITETSTLAQDVKRDGDEYDVNDVTPNFVENDDQKEKSYVTEEKRQGMIANNNQAVSNIPEKEVTSLLQPELSSRDHAMNVNCLNGTFETESGPITTETSMIEQDQKSSNDGCDINDLTQKNDDKTEEFCVTEESEQRVFPNNSNTEVINITPERGDEITKESAVLQSNVKSKRAANTIYSSLRKKNERQAYSKVIRELNHKNFACSYCDKVFTKSYYVKVHERTHTKEKPYICPLCDKRFTQIGTLISHKLVHTSEKPFECGNCDKHFKSRKQLKIHTCKILQCICGQKFSALHRLRAHMRKKCCPKSKTTEGDEEEAIEGALLTSPLLRDEKVNLDTNSRRKQCFLPKYNSGLATNSIFWSDFCIKSWICPEGQSTTPYRGENCFLPFLPATL